MIFNNKKQANKKRTLDNTKQIKVIGYKQLLTRQIRILQTEMAELVIVREFWQNKCVSSSLGRS